MMEKIQIQENMCHSCGIRPISANGKCGQCLANEFDKKDEMQGDDKSTSDYSEYEKLYDDLNPGKKDDTVAKSPMPKIYGERLIGAAENTIKTIKGLKNKR